jgi:ketosteroid isomerase-like protein
VTEPQVQELLELNRAFYEAFEARDIDAMSDLWEHTDRVTCTHPGWAVLRGWGAVAASWVAMFQGPQRIQFILTDERAEVAGEIAGEIGWVTLDENIIGAETGSTVSALNLFLRTDRGWRLVAHHGSAIAS